MSFTLTVSTCSIFHILITACTCGVISTCSNNLGLTSLMFSLVFAAIFCLNSSVLIVSLSFILFVQFKMSTSVLSCCIYKDTKNYIIAQLIKIPVVADLGLTIICVHCCHFRPKVGIVICRYERSKCISFQVHLFEISARFYQIDVALSNGVGFQPIRIVVL